MPLSPANDRFYLRPQAADTVPRDRTANVDTLGTGAGTISKVDVGGGVYRWRVNGLREASIPSFDFDTTQSTTACVWVLRGRLSTNPTFGSDFRGVFQFAQDSDIGNGLRMTLQRVAGAINVFHVYNAIGEATGLDIDDGVLRTWAVRVVGGAGGSRKFEVWRSDGGGTSAPDFAITNGTFGGNVGATAFDTVSMNVVGDGQFDVEIARLSTPPVADATDAVMRQIVTDFDAAFGSGDTTAPTLTSPAGTGGTLTCSGSVSTNEGNGTLYAVFTGIPTAPSAAQVKLGQDHTGAAALRAVSQAVSATGTQNISSGAITAGTRYMHLMHEDAAANQSAVVSSASFAVSAGGDTTAPTLSSPTGTGGTLTGSGSVTTNEGNGTLWWKVDGTATAADPGAGNEAAAGWTSQAVSATGGQTVSNFGALTAGTKYAHYLHPDAAGNRSAVVNSSGFTVSSAATYSASWTMGFVTNLTSGLLHGNVPWSGFYAAYDANAPGAVPSTPIAASGTLSNNTLSLNGIPFTGPLKLHLAIGSGASAAHYTLLLNAA